MNKRTIRQALRFLVMLAMGPVFCAAVGITVIHAWLDGRRRPPARRPFSRAGVRYRRLRPREQAPL
ncbi:hypothetical protein WME79_29595 [Sorangium sp. So ce726]|uniref:hypothetical protein n=1 Tax=Sorangium sp. So ce726 TaxID=3133319 RepID=UPI003F632482